MLLVLDNYDSFTYNLVQALAELGAEVKVVKNDQISVEEIEKMGPKGIVLSPGPGRPEEAGICLEVIEKFRGRVPILGVCLGHQAIGLVFGAKVRRAREILHGKESPIFHEGSGLFAGMSQPFMAGRYHSLVVEEVPEALIVDARSGDGAVMAMHHVVEPIYGVQFHPESILTPEGKSLLRNFLCLIN